MKAALARHWARLTGSGTGAIGLYLGFERLTMVQMDAAGPLPTISGAASIPYDFERSELLADRGRFQALLNQAFSESPFRGKRVVSCMPNDQIKLMAVNFTAASGETDADAVLRELRQRLRSDLAGKIVDFVLVRQQEFPPRPNEAIVAIAERTRVTAYLDMLRGCGLDVDALEIGPVALTRVASWIGAPGREETPNLLVITFGARSSYLTVVWGRRLMLDRGVDFAEHQLVSRLAKVLEMSEPAAMELLLARGFVIGTRSDEDGEVGQMLKDVLSPALASLKSEVARTLDYTKSKTHGRSVDKIYLAGSLARYPGIEDFLREHFTLPVEVLSPFSVFHHTLKLRDMELLWPHAGVVAATGMALRGVPAPWPK